MILQRNCLVTVQRLSAYRVLSAQTTRHQTNVAAADPIAPADSGCPAHANKKVRNDKEPKISWEDARPFEEMPKITSFDLLRNFLPGGKFHKLDPEHMMIDLRKQYGDIVYWPGLFGKPAMVVTQNPVDFETTLRNEGIWPERPGTETLKHYRENLRKDFFQGVEGLITTQGKPWGDFRSATNPVLMQPKNVKLYMNKMSQINREFIDRIKEIRNPKTFEVPDTFEEEVNRWTLESVSVVALDKQLGLLGENRNDPTAKKLFNALTRFFTYTYDLEFKPSLWKYFPVPTFNRLVKALDEIRDITLAYVTEAMERVEEQQARGIVVPENEQSVLEKLLKIDKRVATVMAMDMLMAGVDTTSTTFTSAMLCLAKNPEKQQKLREEIQNILPNKDSEFTVESFNHMPYLRACIKESQRINPLTLGNARMVKNDVVLSGYRIPKDTFIMMIFNSLVEDENYYARPKEFIPERWLRSEAAKHNDDVENPLKSSNPFVFLPFGFGVRSCIGKRIAEMELELGIARVIRNFHVEYNHPTDNFFKMLILKVPTAPLTFTFKDVTS